MSTPSPLRRAPEAPGRTGAGGAHPLAVLATVAVLLAAFGATFVLDPGRPAPADDPAYYTWRTELLIAEGPRALLMESGPQGMFSGGYRVAANLLGALFRRIAGVAPLTWTVWLMVGLRVLIPLLLAAFVARHRRDPLAVPVVGVVAGSLMLTPPLGGYVDNVLALMFLSASAFLLEPARRSWTARIALFGLLVTAGFTHPTTLVIFCGVLVLAALARLVFKRFDLRGTLDADGPTLATAFGALAFTVLAWKLGPWGVPAGLGDAALPPPAGADFFEKRLGGWLRDLNPALNGPLFALGLAALLALGRRWVDDPLARLSVSWLAPLAGLFGFALGLTYPYYRFLNTTPSWVLLTGLGALVAVRFFVARLAAGKLYATGLVALAVIVAANLVSGYANVGWNERDDAWITPAEQRDLDAVRAALGGVDRPVVFTVTTTAEAPERIWGAVKRAGNVSRYGVPGDLLDDTYVCLGDALSCASRRPIGAPDGYLHELSAATIDDIERGLAAGDGAPIVIQAAVFNEPLALPQSPVIHPDRVTVWSVDDGAVTDVRTGEVLAVADPLRGGTPAPLRPLAALGGLVLLLLPGWFVLRRVLPGAGLAETLALVPALSCAALVLCGLVLMALTRTPFSTTAAAGTLALALLGGLAVLVSSPRPGSEP